MVVKRPDYIRRPISCAAMGRSGLLVVVCDDGTVWLWGERQPKDESEALDFVRRRAGGEANPHEWIAFHSPIPGSLCDPGEVIE